MEIKKRLKSKLAKVIITSINESYGSITIDEDLMDAADIHEYDCVEVNGYNVSSRVFTYVLKGKRGSGIIEINGGMLKHFKRGDQVHILKYVWTNQYHNVNIVYTDENNKII